MTVPLHPMLVHLPIALAVLMPLVALGLLLAWRAALLPRRTWAVVAALQAVLVVSGVAALRSGEADEDRAERLVPEAAIEAHEEAAEGFVWAAAVVFVLAAAATVLPREALARGLAWGATAGTVAVLGLGVRTGKAGGELVYVHGAAGTGQAQAAGAAPPGAEVAAPRAMDDDD